MTSPDARLTDLPISHRRKADITACNRDHAAAGAYLFLPPPVRLGQPQAERTHRRPSHYLR